MAPTPSILTSTKKILGITEDDTNFDLDIITHINSVFTTLNDLGIGPADEFSIEDEDATWDDFFGATKKNNSVKTYMYLRVRLLFDPPTSSFAIQAMQEQIAELVWRINVKREESEWTPATA